MRYGWHIAAFLTFLGLVAGGRKVVSSSAPSAAGSNTVHTSDYGPIPPGH